MRRLPLSGGGGGGVEGDFVGDLLELGGVGGGDGDLAVEELVGRAFGGVVVDGFVDDEGGEVVALGVGVVLIGGVEIEGGVFDGLAGEGGAD